MYWLTQEDPIYQYNLLRAYFNALDELFPENRHPETSNAEKETDTKKRERLADFWGKWFGFHPKKPQTLKV